MWQWAHGHGVHWSYHLLHYPEATRMIEWWNDLLKNSLKCQLEDDILQRWDIILHLRYVP